MNILVTSHDAGGAEVVSAWVKANPQHDYRFVLGGPAERIFTRKLSSMENHMFDELADLLPTVEMVLAGTSWASDMEIRVLNAARTAQVESAAYLDHWCNYKERFSLGGKQVLPNSLWVGDNDGYELARRVFAEDDVRIRLEPNLYFEEIRSEYSALPPQVPHDGLNLLYICEPVAEHALKDHGDEYHFGYTELDAMQHFFDTLTTVDKQRATNQVRIRLHPSEESGKYDRFIEHHRPFGCHESKDNTLFEDFRWADLVVGVSSMALVMGTLVDKRVFSCKPVGARTVDLPIKQIQAFHGGALS